MDKGDHYITYFENRGGHVYTESIIPMCHHCFGRLVSELPAVGDLKKEPWADKLLPDPRLVPEDELPIIGLYHDWNEYFDEEDQYNCSVCHGKEDGRFVSQNSLIERIQSYLILTSLHDELVRLTSLDNVRELLQSKWN